MTRDVKLLIERHKAFWEMKPVEYLLTGYCVGGWSQMQLYQEGINSLQTGLLEPDMLKPELFLNDYQRILEPNDVIDDDLIRSAEPFPAIPWMEAIIGCPVHNSGKNIWSEPLNEADKGIEQIKYDPDSPWVKKYMEFIDVLVTEFGSRYPIGQAILRGPVDMLSAAFGEVKFIYALQDNPDRVARIACSYTELYKEFLRDQVKRFPEFRDGYVIGQYHIWSPDKCSRLQDDASALLSPQLYKRFFQDLDREVAKVTGYNLMHLHTTSLFLLDFFLEIDEINLIQVSLDVGGPKYGDIVDSLKKIQEAGKQLLVKGSLDRSTIVRVQEELDTKGLFLQIVVNNVDEAKRLQDSLVY